MSKATPGPWIARIPDDLGGSRVYVDRKGGSLIATPAYMRDENEAEANARLIAAAPNLLAACKRAVDFGLRDTSYCSNETDEVCAELEAAIAKATGQES